MPITQATTNVVNLNKDTLINGLTVGRGGSDISNSVVGGDALAFNTTGSANTAIGYNALRVNTTGARNTAIGFNALSANQTGQYNTAIGDNALQACKGGGNTSIGRQAAYSLVNGFDNTAIGTNALYFGGGTSAGNFNTACGAGALATNAPEWTNTGGFGNNAIVTNNNQIRIGDSNVTSVTCQTNAWSDERDKADIRDTMLGLDFIKKLRPVDFKWDFREDYRPKMPNHVDKPIELKEDASDEEKAKYDEELSAYNTFKVDLDKWRNDVKFSNLVHDGTHKRNRYHHGLIAQEVKKVIEQTGIDFGGFQDNSFNGGDAVMTIGYTELIGPLIKAVQELSAEVASLKAK
jgi:heat shock protein HslJ